MTGAGGSLHFDDEGLTGGIWRGRLTGPTAPARLLLVQGGAVLAEATPEADPDGGWRVTLPVPAEALGQGVSVLLLLADAGAKGAPPQPEAQQLAALTLTAGAPVAGDLLAELALLRGEVDLLKRLLRELARR